MSHHTRATLTGFIFAGLFFVMCFGAVWLAMGCDNYSSTFRADIMPVECKISKNLDQAGLLGNLVGWLILFGIPSLGAGLFWRLSAPHKKSE